MGASLRERGMLAALAAALLSGTVTVRKPRGNGSH